MLEFNLDPALLTRQTIQFMAGLVFGGGGVGVVWWKVIRRNGNGKPKKLKPHYHPELVNSIACLDKHQDLRDLLDAKLEAGNERMKGIEAVGKANNKYLEAIIKRPQNGRATDQ